MSVLNSIIGDLRERRLWPVALVLLLAIIAVPMLLSKSAAKVPVAAAPQAAGPGAPGSASALPVVTVSGLPGRSHLSGRGRDPFTQPKIAATGGLTTSVSSTTPTSTGGTTGGGTGTGGTGGTTGGTGTTPSGGTGGGTTTTPGTTTPPLVPQHPAKPAPKGLTATEAYRVTVSITNSQHGVDKIGSLERLGTLPSASEARLIELGVLKGGKRVLFAVQPGTVLGGPGTCIPGPINCQVLSLAPDEIESVGRATSTGVVSLAMFAVTAISADHYASAARANKARGAVSPVGRRLINRSSAAALSLFPYRPGLGVIVDLRDVSIGGL